MTTATTTPTTAELRQQYEIECKIESFQSVIDPVNQNFVLLDTTNSLQQQAQTNAIVIEQSTTFQTLTTAVQPPPTLQRVVLEDINLEDCMFYGEMSEDISCRTFKFQITNDDLNL